MKKIYSFLIASCASLLAIDANAQCEITDTLTTDFVSVSPETVGQYCQDETINQVVQLIAIDEIAFDGITGDVETIEITSLSNVPDSIEYSCPTNCVFTAGTDGYVRGCILISGQAQEVFDDSITINMQVNGTVNLGTFNLSQSIDTSANARIVVLDANDSRCVTGLESFDIESELSIFPNPANQSNTTVNLNMPESALVDIALYDVLGNKVGNVFNGQLTAGNNSFNLENLDTNQGMYLIKIEVQTANGVNSYTERIIIE